MATKRSFLGGSSSVAPREGARGSKSDRYSKPRVTRLGSFQDDSEAIMIQARSVRSRSPSQETPEHSETKRRSSYDPTKPPRRLPEIAELRGSYKNINSPPSSPPRGAMNTGRRLSSIGSSKQQGPKEDRLPLQLAGSTKRPVNPQKFSPSTPAKPSQGQSSGYDYYGANRGLGSSYQKRPEESRSIRPQTENVEARVTASRERMGHRALPLPLPPRSFYAPGSRASQAIARLQKRTQIAGANVLFPMFPGRPCIAAGRGTRIELHVHLEGAVRPATIWELMKMKKMTLPGDGSVRAVKDAILVTEPVHPSLFFEPVPIYLQCIVGDLNALERIAYEFCEDKVREGILYVEVRYSPHMLLGNKLVVPRGRSIHDLSEVVMAINRGFRVGEREFGIVVRTILSLVAGWSGCGDIIGLVQQFRDDGVVGIDLHMPYEGSQKEATLTGMQTEEVPLSRDEVKAYMQAAHLGISRTVHAGLLGSAYMVQRGIEKYRAQRIGHGYEVLKLPQLYLKSKERDVHFECCPWLSLMSCSVDPTEPKHPIAQFAEDGANFSLNTSHPTLTGLTLQEEYDLVASWGLTEVHLVRSNINALRSSFLQPSEKSNLMQTLLENLGIKRRGKK